MVSCQKDPSLDEPEQVEDLYKHGVLFHSKAYVAPDIEADLREALYTGIESISVAPDASVPLLVVNKIGDLGETVLQDCFESGKTIAVVNPVKSEIDAYVDAHPWLEIYTDNINPGMMLYSFNYEGGYAHIYYPEDLASYESKADAYFLFLQSWFTRLNDEYVVKKPFQRDNNDIPNLDDLAHAYKDQVTYSYQTDYEYRHVALSDPDKLKGKGSMTLDFSLYMAHVYEGEPGSGDYYAFHVTASMANGDMYDGRSWNKHGGVYVRKCGFYATEGTFEIRLVDSKKDDYPVVFAETPSPTTDNGHSSYTESQSFSLQASQSVTGGVNSKGKGIQAEVGVTEGWEWSSSTSREIPDMSIRSLTSGSVVKWGLVFNNLPEYDYSCYRGFKVQDGNHAYSSSVELKGSWLWYDKTGKDDTYKDPLQLCVQMVGKYDIMSWISSRADLKTDHLTFDSGKKYVSLPLINTNTYGRIVLVNDFPDGKAIRDIEVKDADSGKVYKTISNTLTNGKELVLGTYTPLLNYTVSFKTVEPGGTASKSYSYSAHSYFNLSHMETTTLYANYDFSLVD